VLLPPVSPVGRKLRKCVEASFKSALEAARIGNRVSDIGRAVEREVRRHGFSVLRTLCGHGVGRTIHEPPEVPNFFDPRSSMWLTEGLVLAVEPMISAEPSQLETAPDGWTVRTRNRSLTAHYEHTLVITRGEPRILTALAA
jgi:methionyl aminopeptidase